MGVDLNEVWNVIEKDLPLLKQTVDEMRTDINNREDGSPGLSICRPDAAQSTTVSIAPPRTTCPFSSRTPRVPRRRARSASWVTRTAVSE